MPKTYGYLVAIDLPNDTNPPSNRLITSILEAKVPGIIEADVQALGKVNIDEGEECQ